MAEAAELGLENGDDVCRVDKDEDDDNSGRIKLQLREYDRCEVDWKDWLE
jgi:hypothetical protein